MSLPREYGSLYSFSGKVYEFISPPRGLFSSFSKAEKIDNISSIPPSALIVLNVLMSLSLCLLVGAATNDL